HAYAIPPAALTIQAGIPDEDSPPHGRAAAGHLRPGRQREPGLHRQAALREGRGGPLRPVRAEGERCGRRGLPTLDRDRLERASLSGRGPSPPGSGVPRQGASAAGRRRHRDVVEDPAVDSGGGQPSGQGLRAHGRQGAAAEAYHTAIGLRPNYADAHFNLAEAIEDTQPRRALTAYENYLAYVENTPGEKERIETAKKRIEALKKTVK